jgi:signal transduction histidine kinase
MISRDLHDDVGSTLTGIIMMSAIAEQSNEYKKEEAAAWLKRIGNTSREMMDNMRDIVWSINPSKDVMLEVVARMKQYAAQLFEAGDVRYFFDVDEKVFTLQLDFIYKRNIYLIFKEAVNNISKYAVCSELSIQLSIHDNKLEMKISDNGKGFDITQKESGNGLRNMEQRAKQIKGRLFIESAEGKGTQIKLIAPLTRIRYWQPKAFR